MLLLLLKKDGCWQTVNLDVDKHHTVNEKVIEVDERSGLTMALPPTGVSSCCAELAAAIFFKPAQ